MNESLIRTLAALGLAATLTAGSAASFATAAKETKEVDVKPGFEQVDSIVMMRRPHSWQAIDDKTVIVWATPFDPYLVELKFAAHDLKWAHAIGITQVGSRVYAKFDAVQVGGFRYPIDSIYKLTREEARNYVRDARA
jgi:hypothetical protein